MVRNSRLPDSLRGDLDSEVAACRLGAERVADLFRRYGRAQVEACFDAILERTTQTFKRELLAKIPDGTYVWEDYAEHDGVDPPRLHAQRMTLTKTPDKLVIDFTGTSPQAKGPINHAGNYADGSDTIHVVPDSKNLPAEFTETRFPLRVERLALAPDSGGAGKRRGGLGYLKEILGCWGLAGGHAGAPFRVTVDPDGPNERILPGLVDDEPIAAGTLVRIETTGGGGWGDALDREPELVGTDVLEGKVSDEAAREVYGVVVRVVDGATFEVDANATTALRAQLRAQLRAPALAAPVLRPRPRLPPALRPRPRRGRRDPRGDR